MMTNIGRFIIGLILVVVLYGFVRCQSITFEPPANLPVSEQNRSDWKLSFTTLFQNKLETDNKLPLIDAPVTFTSAQFSKIDRYGYTELRSDLAFAHKRNENNQYLGFGIERNQRLNSKFDFQVGGSYRYTRTKRFASIYSGITAKLFESEQNSSDSKFQLKQSELFSKVEYFTPTESGFAINRGFTVSGGFENQFNIGRVWLQPTTQLIWDNGALLRGQRTIGNVDFLIGYQFNKLCVGGGLDYSRFLSGRPQERNSIVGKFFVRYN